MFGTICQNVNGRERINDTARCHSALRQIGRERGERFNLLTFRGKGHGTGKTHVATRSHVPLSRPCYPARFSAPAQSLAASTYPRSLNDADSHHLATKLSRRNGYSYYLTYVHVLVRANVNRKRP